MIFDFHTHTFLSDGENSPIELVRYAIVSGYRCIGITDHASYCNIDELVKMVTKDCKLAEEYWDIIAVPGVELTNVPAKSINEMAKYAKELGAKIVIVHGESMIEKVEPGTNWEAVNSKYIDILAHPGIFTIEEAKAAVKNDIYIEITSRNGHCLSNGVVVKIGTQAGVKFLINSDSHSHKNLYIEGLQEKVALAAGLTKQQIEEIFTINNKNFIKKIGY
jgi:histidinol phosphatase-like PHP family hydrolase